MKRYIIYTLLTVCCSLSAFGQTIYDAASLTEKDLNGTARFVSMGGAMSALGGDLSVMATNPAGIGIYRSNDAALSFGLAVNDMESNYRGSLFDKSKTRGSFDQIGIVFANRVGTVTALRYVNFGFGYRRAKSFHRDMLMGGSLGDYSQTFQMASQAEGLTSWGSSPYTNDNIGWLSILGYDSYLITDLVSESDASDYDDVEEYTLNGEQVSNTDGELMYRTPGYYRGMYTDGTAYFLSRERGGIDEFDFNVSANYNDRVYLGVTFGVYAVNYKKYSYYSEDYGNSEGYYLKSWSKISGAGMDVKFGLIFRPVETSPFRIGLSVHTPVFYDLDYKTRARVTSDVLNYLDTENESGVGSGKIGQYTIDTRDVLGGSMARSFRLRTPWTFNLSLGHTVGRNWAFGAEYEYQDYSSVKFKDLNGHSSVFAYENSTRGDLRGVSTFRVGIEFKPETAVSIRLGYNYRSSIFEREAYKDLPYNSIQTDTDFSNLRSLHAVTAGLGYRGKRFYGDVAYSYTHRSSDFYPIDFYDGYSLVRSTDETQVRHRLIFTLGVKL